MPFEPALLNLSPFCGLVHRGGGACVPASCAKELSHTSWSGMKVRGENNGVMLINLWEPSHQRRASVFTKLGWTLDLACAQWPTACMQAMSCGCELGSRLCGPAAAGPAPAPC